MAVEKKSTLPFLLWMVIFSILPCRWGAYWISSIVPTATLSVMSITGVIPVARPSWTSTLNSNEAAMAPVTLMKLLVATSSPLLFFGARCCNSV